jgi:hypothetical protein
MRVVGTERQQRRSIRQYEYKTRSALGQKTRLNFFANHSSQSFQAGSRVTFVRPGKGLPEVANMPIARPARAVLEETSNRGFGAIVGMSSSTGKRLSVS